MGRLKDFMDKMERGEEADSEAGRAAERDALMNRQKEADLARAQARSVARPIKKELRHSRIEGRYILPEEIKKEVEKLEKAKQEAARKGVFGKLFRKKEKKRPPENKTEKNKKEEVKTDSVPDTPSETEVKKNEKEQRKQKAEQIKRLRGITKEKRLDGREVENRFAAVNGLDQPPPAPVIDKPQVPDDIPSFPQEEYGSVPQETESRFSFAETVQRLTGVPDPRPQEFSPPLQELPVQQEEYYPDPLDDPEYSRFLFAPFPADRPDGIIATALSAAVGFVYFDEDDQPVDRIITIRKLFYRQGDILIDAFCHDIAAPRLILFSRGIKMYNLKTMRPYENPRDLLLHHITGLSEDEKADFSGFTAALAIVRYELTALIYVAKSDFDRSEEENNLMLSYVSRRCPTIDFDENEMLDYIAMLVPDEQSFSEALDVIVKQPSDVVFLFVRTFLQMMLSDGILHENERELLAELLFLLQAEGIELNRIGLG